MNELTKWLYSMESDSQWRGLMSMRCMNIRVSPSVNPQAGFTCGHNSWCAIYPSMEACANATAIKTCTTLPIRAIVWCALKTPETQQLNEVRWRETNCSTNTGTRVASLLCPSTRPHLHVPLYMSLPEFY